MTPAERARQIDKEEFAAECAAVRQRAYALFKVKPQCEKRVREWIRRIEPKRSIAKPTQQRNAVEKSTRTHAANAVLHEAFGHKRTLNEWAAETGIATNTIRSRLKYGWTIENALTRTVQGHKKQRRAGVVSNLSAFEGTGAGSTSQETPNITFSGNDA
jgi:hypothetical protein